MTINCLAQKIRKFNFRNVKRRVAGYKELQDENMNSAMLRIFGTYEFFATCENSHVAKFCNLQNFAGCEISQPANFRRLRKFSQPEKSSGIFCSSKTEHLQKNKTKNCKKLSKKNKKIYQIWKLKDLNENPKVKIEIKQSKNLIKVWSGFQVPAETTLCDAKKRSHGGSRSRSSSMLAVRCT